MFLHDGIEFNEKIVVMRMMFGGQIDEYDFHKVGLTWDFARQYFRQAGFRALKRVKEFGIFDDASSLKVADVLISLNVEALK